MMNKKVAIWLATLTFMVCLLAQLPASVLSSPLAKSGVQTGALSGTLWHGQAQQLKVGVLNLGEVQWQWQFLPLFTGKVAADIHLKQDSGSAEARIAMTLTGRIIVTQLKANLPLQSLIGAGGLPGGWIGSADVNLEELVFVDNWPVKARGQVKIVNLTGPAQAPNNIGSYRLTFPSNNPSATDLVGNLSDEADAALGVTGTLTLGAKRSYQLDTWVVARPNAPASIAQGMAYLGAADAEGRRNFTMSGTF